jgi:Na+-translocating ferredoxin:NAD+ oxidoreductase subunit G
MTTPEEPKYRKRIGYQAMLLGGFATFASVFLVSGNIATKDAINDRLKEDLLQSLSQVVPDNLYDNNLLDNILEVSDKKDHAIKIYRGFKGSQVSALAWQISVQGFADEIKMIIGVDTNGKILGVRVISHSETPGLGDKIEEKKSNWIFGFNGLSLGNPPLAEWKVKKDGGRFDAFSGATITPRAVVKGITAGLEFFKANRSRLIAIPDQVDSSVSVSSIVNTEKADE